MVRQDATVRFRGQLIGEEEEEKTMSKCMITNAAAGIIKRGTRIPTVRFTTRIAYPSLGFLLSAIRIENPCKNVSGLNVIL